MKIKHLDDLLLGLGVGSLFFIIALLVAWVALAKDFVAVEIAVLCGVAFIFPLITGISNYILAEQAVKEGNANSATLPMIRAAVFLALSSFTLGITAMVFSFSIAAQT